MTLEEITPNKEEGLKETTRRYSDFVGEVTMQAYADILDGRIVDGLDDGGVDVEFRDGNKLVKIQIKSSYEGSKESVRESIKTSRVYTCLFR
ncbi:MAG: hypothetical protein WCW56_00020 [Candidatus Paceibacterota bacterium]